MKFKRLHTLFNINSDKYGLHSNANKFHKTKIIYMYFHALQKITRNSPTIMCWITSVGTYKHPSDNYLYFVN